MEYSMFNSFIDDLEKKININNNPEPDPEPDTN